MDNIKHVIVGASHRSFYMFADYLTNNPNTGHKLVGIYDTNIHRSNYFKQNFPGDFKVYSDFDLMIGIEKPDSVIVTTSDESHHKYIIKALDYGCDVISEKPITTEIDYCKAILAAKRRNPDKDVAVTFNLRFTPYLSKVKSLIESGEIGKILSVNYEYLLDKSHGADYFRRWHRTKRASGSMLVHKSTHHFDVANWLIDDNPLSVSAQGNLIFYGHNGKFRGERCYGCEHKAKCNFYMDITANKFFKEFYFDAENIDGYYRDSCVFSEEIDNYDNMGVVVKYEKGGILTYSLSMFNEYEGYKISIAGQNGRIEAFEYYSGEMSRTKTNIIKVFKDGKNRTIRLSKATGGHSGGDIRLLREIFSNKSSGLNKIASVDDAIKSALIGICARKSIEEEIQVNIGDYLDEMLIRG